MAFQLAASAAYVIPSDMVLVHLWLHETVSDQFKPQEVKTCLVELLNRNLRVVASATLDARHGNSDGGFHPVFLHPPEYRDLTARVTLETFQDGTYRAEAVVHPETVKVPLEQQPGTR